MVQSTFDDGRWNPEMYTSYLGILDEYKLISKEDYEAKINKVNDKASGYDRLARIMAMSRYP